MNQLNMILIRFIIIMVFFQLRHFEPLFIRANFVDDKVYSCLHTQCELIINQFMSYLLNCQP